MLSGIMFCSTDLTVIFTRTEFGNMFNSLTFLTLGIDNIGLEFHYL